MEIPSGSELLAFDIKTTPLPGPHKTEETSALDPASAAVSSIAFFGPAGSQVYAVGAPGVDSEVSLLSAAAVYLSERPATEVLVGWNSSGFELPFLAARFDRAPASLHTLAPEITELPTPSKYGTPAYDGTWVGHSHYDICHHFRDFAQTHDLPWTRQSLARALRLLPATQTDRPVVRGKYTPSQGQAHALSDVRLTYQLATLAAVLSPAELSQLTPR